MRLYSPVLPGAKPALRLALFALLVLGIYVLEIGVTRNALLFEPPSLVYGAVAIDLTVFVALLFYGLIVRPRKASPWSVLPVFLLSLFAASLILPVEQQRVLHGLRLVAIPAELMSFGTAAWLITRTVRRFRSPAETASLPPTGDWGERLHTRLEADHSAPFWLRAVCDEIIMGYFALVAWRIKTPHPSLTTFTYHRENGWGGMLGAILVMTAFELPAEHFLVGQWNAPLAWFLAASSLYGLFWLWADWQAIRLRPLLYTPDGLHLRIGLRWNATLPYDTITEIRRVKSHPTLTVPGGHLKATLWGQPNLRLHLVGPVSVRGPFGMRRTAQYISLFVDDLDAFIHQLETHGYGAMGNRSIDSPEARPT